MALPAHEGLRSRQRIEAYVQDCQCANLTVSHESLAVDLDRADIVVSEYSQVLIDAVASGRLGIAANLTGRRSLMATYRSMGLLEVTAAESLIDELSKVTTILLTEQNVKFALTHASRGYVIEKGVIRHHATTEDYRADPTILEKYLSV